MWPSLFALSLAAAAPAPLTFDTIRDVVHEHRAKVRQCYDRSDSGKKSRAGKVTVRFVISEQGTVSESAVKASELADAGLEACVVAEVKSWVFPKPKHGAAAINFPFHFGPPTPGKGPKADDELVE